jgi:hypothetical protein
MTNHRAIAVKLGWVLVMVLATVLALTDSAQAASRQVNIGCGQDIDSIINGDPAGTTTRFVLGADCTFTASATVVPRNGDEVYCAITPIFVSRAPAWDPETRCTIQGSSTLTQVMKPQGNIQLVGIMVRGGNYNGNAGTGVGIAEGTMGPHSWIHGVVVRDTEGAGISNAHGVHYAIELTNTTTDPNALGHIGSGIKGVDEFAIQYSYVHDNQGNGIWCDEHCNDVSGAPYSVFHVNLNLVVNNGREGIRYEKVGDTGGASEASAGEALIENNEVHGNGWESTRAGIGARDSQHALIRNNVFGATTIAGVSYGKNVGGAIRASDSGRSDRPDLLDIGITNNTLNGEVIKGCELPDSLVYCF